MERTVLHVEEIVKDFDGVRAVDGISFDVERGEILGFLGPNGAGKTTSMRMVLGILRPDRGAIRSGIGPESGTIAKDTTGYLPEERGLYDDCGVLDTLCYFGELKGLPRAEAARRAEEWLERFDLAAWRRSRIEKLSKGMQQKVQFAAAVLHTPDLLVLDEPFSGLDPLNQDFVKATIRELRDAGTAILLSSHQMNLVEEMCDRILLIHRGRRVLYGNLADIKTRHGEHVARVRFEGDADALARIDGIADLRLDGDRASFRLTQALSPDAFLRALPDSITVLELSVSAPPLHDIFVRTIGGGSDEAL